MTMQIDNAKKQDILNKWSKVLNMLNLPLDILENTTMFDSTHKAHASTFKKDEIKADDMKSNNVDKIKEKLEEIKPNLYFTRYNMTELHNMCKQNIESCKDDKTPIFNGLLDFHYTELKRHTEQVLLHVTKIMAMNSIKEAVKLEKYEEEYEDDFTTFSDLEETDEFPEF